MKRLIVVEIEANGRYCNNNCKFMNINANGCHLFEVDLVWKTGKKENGNIRPNECRKAEQK